MTRSARCAAGAAALALVGAAVVAAGPAPVAPAASAHTAPAAAAGGVVLPPSSHPYGKTYSQWSALWWVWALEAQDVPSNPGVDPNAGTASSPEPVDCTLGQSGNVWFIPGVTFYQKDVPNHRSCTVPAGTSIFFPLIDSWQDNTSCPGSPDGTLTRKQLNASIHQLYPAITPGSMHASIDGQSVKGLGSVRTVYKANADGFYYTLPSNNALSMFCASDDPFPAGTRTAPPGGSSAGVYVMTAPLGQGTHTIHLHAQADFSTGTFTEDVTYTITASS